MGAAADRDVEQLGDGGGRRDDSAVVRDDQVQKLGKRAAHGIHRLLWPGCRRAGRGTIGQDSEHRSGRRGSDDEHGGTGEHIDQDRSPFGFDSPNRPWIVGPTGRCR